MGKFDGNNVWRRWIYINEDFGKKKFSKGIDQPKGYSTY